MILRAVVVSVLVLGQSDVRLCGLIYKGVLVNQNVGGSVMSKVSTEFAVDNPEGPSNVPVPESTLLRSRNIRGAITRRLTSRITKPQSTNLNLTVVSNLPKNVFIIEKSTQVSTANEKRITAPFSTTHMYTSPSRNFHTRGPPKAGTAEPTFKGPTTRKYSIYNGRLTKPLSSKYIPSGDRREPTPRPTSTYTLCKNFMNSHFPIRQSTNRASGNKPDYIYVNRLFPGLLKNISSVANAPVLDSPSASRSSASVRSHNWGLYDGDIHCPTLQKITRVSPTMTNAYGLAKDIVSFEDAGMYQFMHTGTCVNFHQKCTGSCHQQTTTVYLLVWNMDFTFSFDPFEIPAYCSCKNIQG